MYGLTVLLIAVAIAIAQLLQGFVDATPLFFAAVMASTWFGGRGPGLLAVLLAAAAFDYFFVPPLHTVTLGLNMIPRVAVFVMSALLISWLSDKRKRAEGSLRQARDGMEAKVQERTADLKQTNEKLQAEIAERERVEEALRERVSLLDLSHDTIFVRDLSDVISYWNRGAEELYGWTSEEATGQVTHSLLQTIFPRPLEKIKEELFGAGRWEGELVHTKRDGSRVVVASRWSLQRDGEGRPVAILETNNDITERKRAEEALQKAQAELAHITRVTTMGELTSSIAHEINQPLAAIVTNANACLRWLATEPPSLDEARESVGRIVRDGHRAGEVVGRVRALFKKTASDKARLDIDDLIKDSVALVKGEVRRNRVLLRTELAPDLPPVSGDRVQLRQVVLNLIINGIEAMSTVTGRPRDLLVRTRRDESGGIHVLVRDSGVGVDPRNTDRLFDAFYTTKAEGIGMGLSVSRSIIEAHGGRLWAASDDGHGATFQFTLPADGRGHHD
jgi:PAS domain S-box-containing protein